ncbi:MAG TPA: hypothetical protein VL332_12495 [Candidatus Saccharimonadaceae bacterium]|nr:hypothetical protein [Candidatus Saccharimonadaceae bacterium]
MPGALLGEVDGLGVVEAGRAHRTLPAPEQAPRARVQGRIDEVGAKQAAIAYGERPDAREHVLGRHGERPPAAARARAIASRGSGPARHRTFVRVRRPRAGFEEIDLHGHLGVRGDDAFGSIHDEKTTRRVSAALPARVETAN